MSAPVQSCQPSIVERLRDDAIDHKETACDWDGRPEDTVNWEHASNCLEAAARIEELESNAREQAKLLADTGRRVEEMAAALRKSETALGKIAAWLGRLATDSEQRAKDNRFPSLAHANATDAKNYRSTIISITPALEATRAALSSGEAGK